MPLRDPAKKQARDLRNRQRHAARVAQNRCTRCARLPPEPGLKVCGSCAEKRRAADKARPRQGQGSRHALSWPRSRAVPPRRPRLEAGLCTSCGLRRPEDSRSVCEPCREARRALDRRRYAARRAAGRCVRCTQPTVGGLSRCGRCLALEKERVSPERESAVSKRRYAGRRARGECVDCKAPTGGAARCPRCAYRSNSRAPERHLVALWPAADHGDRAADLAGTGDLRDGSRGRRLHRLRQAAPRPGGDLLQRPVDGIVAAMSAAPSQADIPLVLWLWAGSGCGRSWRDRTTVTRTAGGQVVRSVRPPISRRTSGQAAAERRERSFGGVNGRLDRERSGPFVNHRQNSHVKEHDHEFRIEPRRSHWPPGCRRHRQQPRLRRARGQHEHRHR